MRQKVLSSPALFAVGLVAIGLFAFGCGAEAPEETVQPWIEELSHGRWLGAACCPELRGAVAPDAEEIEDLPFAELAAVTSSWGGREEWGAWALGDSTELRFHLAEPEARDLVLRTWAPPGLEDVGQDVEVLVEGAAHGSFSVGSEPEEVRVSLPAEAFRAGANQVELRFARHIDGIPGQDDRPLALALSEVALVAPGEDSVVLPAFASQIGYRANREQEAVRFAASGVSLVPVEIAADASAFLFELEASRGAALDLDVLTLDGARERVWSSKDSGKRARVDLAAWRGRRVALLFEAHLPAETSLTLWRPRLAGSGTSPAPAQASTPPPEESPDVVVIVLDAARADHFGFDGYERDTTPEIDAFAAESLVFPNATAECPYTMCSMPNMLTGLNLIQHGLIARGLMLSPEIETLAERLAEKGYQTVGLTSNPNNSTITGCDQGMEIYREIWETHPQYLNGSLEYLLKDRIDPEKPLFLMMHYVPPHEPYDPDPEYDLFGDPDYDGFVTSDREQTRDIYAGTIDLEPEDLAELVSLYDGNLRMADAWVGRLIDLLREHDRWDDALVVLTSDHGEAFDEHGEIGHNTTIYEGMMRVPMVVKPPANAPIDAEQVDLGRLASVGDFLPTVLARLGERPHDEVRTIDLLAPPEPDRYVILRSAQPLDPIWGLRTRRHKALTRTATGTQELYDLEEDPQERNNTAFDQPFLHAALIAFLERERRAPAPLQAGVRDGEISAKDAEMLRNLGYL